MACCNNIRVVAVVLSLLAGALPLWGGQEAVGILIVAPEKGATAARAAHVLEYHTIREQMVPVTDYITVGLLDGDTEQINKGLILQRVVYPKETSRNILSDSTINYLSDLSGELQQVVDKYPQAQPYLGPRIQALQKEVHLFNQGHRKINGTWISGEDYERFLAASRERKSLLLELRRIADAEAAAASARRLAEGAKARSDLSRTGILITKPSPSSPDTEVGSVIEYHSITEHVVPVIRSVTVNKPDGGQEDIPMSLIIGRVDYPPETAREIITDAAGTELITVVEKLRQVVSRYPQTEKYLLSRIVPMEKEADLFQRGYRKINGTWIAPAEYEKMLAADRAKKLREEEDKKAVIEAEAAKKRAELAAQEEKRKSAEMATAKAAEEKRAAAERVAAEVKRKAGLEAKKKMIALVQAKPTPSVASSIKWDAIAGIVIVGAGILVALRFFNKKSGAVALAALDWQKFELLVAEIYRRQGYAVEISAGFGDEAAADFKLTRGGEVMFVRCKHWKIIKNYKISAQEIRDFYEMFTDAHMQKSSEPHQLSMNEAALPPSGEAPDFVATTRDAAVISGTFISSGEYTQEAREFAEGKPLRLMGLGEVELLILQMARPKENLLNISSWIADFSAAVTTVDPSCPICSQPMLLKTLRNGEQGWQCRNYPECLGKLSARIDLLKHRLGKIG